MTNQSSDDPALNWEPPERPEWVQRLNEEGECMDIRGVVPLDERSLLDAAMQKTGLSDFGSDEWQWREPFRVYIKALEEEADLNLMGRLRARQEILLFLEARLGVEDWYKRYPEIDKEEIKQPIIISGQGRSGTSMLQNVLAANPDYGTLRHWEMIMPVPPPEKATYYSDPRIEKADKLVRQWNRVAPTLTGMHEFGGEMPFECCILMSINFDAEDWLAIMAQVPSFSVYLRQRDPEISLRYHKRVLKLLQWRNPRKHWVLKSVFHLAHLPQLFKVYPDACIVWPHRDPIRAFSSVINMMATMQWVGSDHPLKHGALDVFRDPNVMAARFNHVMDLLDAGKLPTKQIYNFLYKDLVADPIGAIEKMHQYFGIPLSDAGREGMARYMRENPRDGRPPHRYPVAKGEALLRAREAYKRYQSYFNIPNE